MTNKEAQNLLGVSGNGLTPDTINKAFQRCNDRCVNLIRFPPKGTDRNKVTQDMVLYMEARDTLIAMCAPGLPGSMPPKPSTVTPGTPHRSRQVMQSARQGSGQPQTNMGTGASSQSNTQNRGRNVVMQWVTARYNIVAWRNFRGALGQKLLAIVQQGRYTLGIISNEMQAGGFNKLIRYMICICIGVAELAFSIVTVLLTTWIGLLFSLLVSAAILGTSMYESGETLSYYKAYSFPACTLYINDRRAGEAPSKDVMSVTQGRHEVEFRTNEGEQLSGIYKFEQDAFYIFQVDFETRRINRSRHELDELFTQ